MSLISGAYSQDSPNWLLLFTCGLRRFSQVLEWFGFFFCIFLPCCQRATSAISVKSTHTSRGMTKKNKIKNKQTKTNCWPPVFHLVFHGSSFWSQRSGVCILRQIHTHHVGLEGPCSIHSMHLNTHTIMNVFCHQAFCFVFLQFSLHIKHHECLCVDIMPLFVTYTSCSCSKTNSYFFLYREHCEQ